MALNLNDSPMLTVHRNFIQLIFPNKSAVQTEFDINGNDFYLSMAIENMNTGMVNWVEPYANIGGAPTNSEEGLNALDIAVNLANGVYRVNNIEITIDPMGANTTSALCDMTYISNRLINIPSMRQSEISNL